MPATQARVVLLNTDVDALPVVARRLALKLARLRLASGLLIAALALAVSGATVELVV